MFIIAYPRELGVDDPGFVENVRYAFIRVVWPESTCNLRDVLLPSE